MRRLHRSAGAPNEALQRAGKRRPPLNAQSLGRIWFKMGKMAPEWLVNAVWFVAGISATGAFWYFLSQRKAS